jgi:8-oxo-dGTP diphosphatase
MWRNKSRPAEPVRVLVRHADAGLRSEWCGSDEWRGLTETGHGQAGALVSMLAHLPILRILSSPSLRCRQTVQPLAVARVLDVEPCWQLSTGAQAKDVIGLLSHPETESAVLCTHRETLETLFEHLAGAGPAVAEAGDPMVKSAVWILRGTGGPDPLRLEYLGSGAALVA